MIEKLTKEQEEYLPIFREALADCGSKIKLEEETIRRAQENIEYYSQIRDEIKFEFLNGVFEFKGNE